MVRDETAAVVRDETAAVVRDETAAVVGDDAVAGVGHPRVDGEDAHVRRGFCAGPRAPSRAALSVEFVRLNRTNSTVRARRPPAARCEGSSGGSGVSNGGIEGGTEGRWRSRLRRVNVEPVAITAGGSTLRTACGANVEVGG